MGRAVASTLPAWKRMGVWLGLAAAPEAPESSAAPPRAECARLEAAEHELADLRGFVEDVLANARDPMMVVELHGAVLMANPAACALGCHSGAGIGTGPDGHTIRCKIKASNGDDSALWPPSRWTAAASEPPRVIGEGPDGRTYEVRSTPLRGAVGRAARWIVQFVDLTPLVEARRGQELARRHRDEALQLLSHDLRSPQAAILSTVNHPAFSQAPPGLRNIIERAARRTLHIADSYMRLVHAESADCVFLPVDLAHAVEEAVDAVWSVGRDAKVKVTFDPPGAEFVVNADRGMLTRALTDLLDDAIKFSGEGTTVSCRLTAAVSHGRPGVACEVVDTARDLSEGELALIFDRFARSGAATVGSMGEGSGLACVKATVARHDGTLTCDHDLVVGRTFTLTLPLDTRTDSSVVCLAASGAAEA